MGREAVPSLYEQGVLIDLSHMSEHSLRDTFALLDELDRESGCDPADHPVIASHGGFRLGSQEYMLSPETICRIRDRNGVIGLIMAQHQLYDGADVRDDGKPAETDRVLRRHIDAIRDCLGETANEHVAIGSDLDGFIKPTVAGVERAGDLATLGGPLRDAYGDDAEAILSGNALRVARSALG